MSKDRNAWIQIFTVNSPQDHPGGFTVYRVTRTTFPVSSPDLATTVTCWRRWSQFEALHKSLQSIHKSLYLSGEFPPLPKSSYFKRKDPVVIETRCAAGQELLEFATGQPILAACSVLHQFFTGGEEKLHLNPGSQDKLLVDFDKFAVSSVKSSQSCPDHLTVSVTHDLSIDTTPTLTPVPSCSPPPPSSPGTAVAATPQIGSGTAVPGADSSPSPVVAGVAGERTEPAADAGSMDSDSSADPKQGGIDLSKEYNTEAGGVVPEYNTEAGGVVPEYITEAASLISAALNLEAEEKLEDSIAAYREAIGKLLSCVQSDPDPTRQSAVKKRIAQYISKAEQLVKLDLENRRGRRGLSGQTRHLRGIPHLELFGQLAELKNYRVRDVLDRRVILAEKCGSSGGELVVFKVLHKSSAVYKRSKTSLLPINISYMVELKKYFETECAVYLMLEHCPAGKLWDLVLPLLHQQQAASRSTVPVLGEVTLPGDAPGPELAEEEGEDEGEDRPEKRTLSTTPVGRKISVLRPSPSFIRERTQSVNFDDDNNSSDSEFSDINYVQAGKSSLIVLEKNELHHYQCEEEEEDDSQDRILQSSQSILENINRSLADSRQEGIQIYNKLQDIEASVKNHLEGNLQATTSSIHSSSSSSRREAVENISDNHPATSPGSPTQSHQQLNSVSPPPLAVPEQLPAVAPHSPSSTPAHQVSFGSVFETPDSGLEKASPGHDGGECAGDSQGFTTSGRPKFLRKLSEILPQCPDPRLGDATHLPDRVVRLWAAELAQVISSLHYRDIVIKDLNPDNILLDNTGHLKLTYQCEWVSVERELSKRAVLGRYTAPEVLSVGEVTPAADWWSYGAILHLLYTGQGPSSLTPTGVDSTIPLEFPTTMCGESINFLTSLLKVFPEDRLGAGSTGSQDIRCHPYFSNFDWNKMSFVD